MALFERRQAPRNPHQGQAMVLLGEIALLVDVEDFSPGGCCAQRPRGWTFNLGDQLKLYMFTGPGPAMQFNARVAWFQDDRIGLEFQR